MSTYQDRAKDLLELFKHNVDMNRMEYDRTGVDNYDAILDQALSELASIIEEEKQLARIDENDRWITLINASQVATDIFDGEVTLTKSNIQARLDQLSNRRGDGHTN